MYTGSKVRVISEGVIATIEEQKGSSYKVRIDGGHPGAGQCKWYQFDQLAPYYQDSDFEDEYEPENEGVNEVPKQPVFQMQRKHKIGMAIVIILSAVLVATAALQPKTEPKTRAEILMEEVNYLNTQNVPEVQKVLELRKNIRQRKAIIESNLKEIYKDEQ